MAKSNNISVELLDNLLTWFPEDDILNTLKMRPNQLEKTVRVNLLKGTREEIHNNLRLENINSKYLRELGEGLIILSNKAKIGSSQAYLSGEIMPQGLGSMLTVDALDPKPGEFILDMAAAPGGKAAFIGERLKGEGLIVANDMSHSRILSLRNNLARHGIENVVISNKNAVIRSHKIAGVRLLSPQAISCIDRPLRGTLGMSKWYR